MDVDTLKTKLAAAATVDELRAVSDDIAAFARAESDRINKALDTALRAANEQFRADMDTLSNTLSALHDTLRNKQEKLTAQSGASGGGKTVGAKAADIGASGGG
jgi:acyl-CoA reductase-like NAD-dependent aldehyde dehydrogenase